MLTNPGLNDVSHTVGARHLKGSLELALLYIANSAIRRTGDQSRWTKVKGTGFCMLLPDGAHANRDPGKPDMRPDSTTLTGLHVARHTLI